MDRDPYDPAPLHAPPHHAADDVVARRVTSTTTGARDWWADRAHLREWAFLGGLVGGVLILVGAFALALLLTVVHLVGAGNEGVWFLDSDNFPGVALAVALWGLLAGGLVLVGALRLKEAAELTALPGAMILVGGILSFFALGGFLVGGLAAIVAGVMAIAAAQRVLPLRDEERGHAPRKARPLS